MEIVLIGGKKETPANSNNIISHMVLMFWEQTFGSTYQMQVVAGGHVTR